MTEIQARDHAGHFVIIQKNTKEGEDTYSLGSEELVVVKNEDEIVLRNRNGKEFIVL